MDSYKKTINRLQEEVSEKRRLVAKDHIATGRHLVTNETDLSGSDKLSKLTAEATAIQSEIDSHRQTIDRINGILDRQQRIEAEIDGHRAEIEQLEESVAPMYEEIGRKAFDIYKSNPFVDQTFVDLFSDLVKNQEDVRDIDQQLVQLERETEEKPFLDRMVAKGKIALLRNRRTTRDQNTPRLLRKAGRIVIESDFVTVVDDAALTRAVEPYHAINTDIDNINRKITDLQNEHAALSDELRKVGADKKAIKRISELEHQIETQRKELELVYQRIGDGYVRELKKDDPGIAAVAEAVARVRTLEKDIQAIEKQIERYNAAIAAEETAARIADYQKKIVSLEQQITEAQASVKKVQQSIAEAEEDKARLEALRGPIDKL